jgi:hypothetical protein
MSYTKNIPAVVFSVDHYSHILPAWVYFYDKLGFEGPIQILHFSETDIRALPWDPWEKLAGKKLSFIPTFINMGNFDNYGTKIVWSEAIRNVQDLLPDIFMYFFESQVIFSAPDLSLLDNAFKIMLANERVVKYTLYLQHAHKINTPLTFLPGIAELPLRADFRMTLAPSLFRKSYLLDSMGINDDPWTYEGRWAHRAHTHPKEAILVPSKEPGSLLTIDAYRKGKKGMSYLDKVGIERAGFYEALTDEETELFHQTCDITTDIIKPRSVARLENA